MKISLIIILAALSITSFSQNITRRLDRKMERQLKPYGEYVPLDSMEIILTDNYPAYMLPYITGARVWRWSGDIEPLTVSYLKCKEPDMYKWAAKNIARKINKKTLFERDYLVPAFRVDTLNEESIIFSMTDEGFGIDEIHREVKRTKNILKGIWIVDGVHILLYGNAIDIYFTTEKKDVKMVDPHPPHRTAGKGSTLVDVGIAVNFKPIKDSYLVFRDGKVQKQHYIVTNLKEYGFLNKRNIDTDFIIDEETYMKNIKGWQKFKIDKR